VKRVYRAASLLQVAHARNVLITAGIDCELRNQYLAGALGDLPMMETWPQLYVDDDDETLALRALARAAAAPVGTMWTCSDCGERLEPQFTQCWRCGVEYADQRSWRRDLRACSSKAYSGCRTNTYIKYREF
jgi:hypothetical protein